MRQIVRDDLRAPNRRTVGRVAGDAADHASHCLREGGKREPSEQECAGWHNRDSCERLRGETCPLHFAYDLVFIHWFCLFSSGRLRKDGGLTLVLLLLRSMDARRCMKGACLGARPRII